MKNQLFALFSKFSHLMIFFFSKILAIAVLFSALPQVFSENATAVINNSTVQTNSSVTPGIQFSAALFHYQLVAELAEPEAQTKNVTQSAPEVNNTVPEKSVVAEPVAVSENKTETTEQAPVASTQNQTTEAPPKTPGILYIQ